jgi:flagellar basal-body rod protein FlgF
MFRGFYTVASGMIAYQRKAEMLTNNMANVHTPGFKADQSAMRAFPEMLLKRIDEMTIPTEKKLNILKTPTVGSLNTGVYMQEAIPNFKQGDLQETSLPTDLALLDVLVPTSEENGLNGALFFTIQHPTDGVRYTRNGNFTIDPEGFLTTSAGWYVLDDEGNRIQLPNDDFMVRPNGVIEANGQEIAQIGIAFAENVHALQKDGEGLYRLPEGTLPNANEVDGVQYQLRQGFIERSNVDPTRTMTDLLTAFRAFEANQKVLQAYDRSMEKAANEIGRIG